jgi:hypothetical protein
MPRGKLVRLTVVDDKPDRPPVLATGLSTSRDFGPFCRALSTAGRSNAPIARAGPRILAA